MTELYVDPAHRVPDEEWAAVVRRAQEIHEAEAANKTGGAASPAGKVIDMRGRSNKHSGVSGLPTQLLVLHSAECPLRGGYAQSLTEWAITSAVIASWQRFIDPFHRVYMIDDMYAAWHASEANPMSIGWEQAGYARFSRAEWTTPDGMLQMESLAYDMAEVAKRDGIPPVWLTTDQVNAITSGRDRTTKGLCTHRQIDPESRTDPGDGYPYGLLLAKIKGYMGAAAIAPQSTKEDTLSAAEVKAINAHTTAQADRVIKYVGEVMVAGYRVGSQEFPGDTKVGIETQRRVSATLALVKAMAANPDLTAEQITAAVEAGLANGVVTVDVNVNGAPA